MVSLKKATYRQRVKAYFDRISVFNSLFVVISGVILVAATLVFYLYNHPILLSENQSNMIIDEKRCIIEIVYIGAFSVLIMSAISRTRSKFLRANDSRIVIA